MIKAHIIATILTAIVIVLGWMVMYFFGWLFVDIPERYILTDEIEMYVYVFFGLTFYGLITFIEKAMDAYFKFLSSIKYFLRSQ